MAVPRTSLDARIYRSSFALFPPAFRRDFAGEMAQDFEDARAEAIATGRPFALWQFRARMLRDLLWTLSVQWARTGWPAIALLAMMTTLTFISILARAWRRMVILLPSGTPDEEVIALEMLTIVVLLVIVATILLTGWSGRLTRRGARRRA
jgi:hypothetical protein